MLRTRQAVRSLSRDDRDAALALCARDLAASVFVAARIVESERNLGAVLGYFGERGLEGLMWTGANLVPVETTGLSRALFAERVRRWRSRTASILGPRDQVSDLWLSLSPSWGAPRAIRSRQPLLETVTPPSALGVAPHPDVRLARPHEVDLVLPAAEHMFTHEIGYRPYVGSSRTYRGTIAGLIAQGRTYVVIEQGEVVFKADVGSQALGAAQLQGVWLAPQLRGRGLSVSYVAAVIEQLLVSEVTSVSLYVNDFNAPALAAYAHVGMREIGEFTTVLL